MAVCHAGEVEVGEDTGRTAITYGMKHQSATKGKPPVMGRMPDRRGTRDCGMACHGDPVAGLPGAGRRPRDGGNVAWSTRMSSPSQAADRTMGGTPHVTGACPLPRQDRPCAGDAGQDVARWHPA
jgi:hypothetical protein